MTKERSIIGIAILAMIAVIVWIALQPSQQLTQAPVQQAKPKAAEKPDLIKLRFGHNTPTNSALHQASLKFAEEVRRKSAGRVIVEVFPAQQLGNDHKMVEMARAGELDILLTPTAKMSVPVPSMQYADLPFLFPSREAAYMMLDGEPGKRLLNNLRSIDLVGVTFWENGFKHFTGNRAFLNPDDFSGTKIRVMKSRIIMDQFKSFGAQPVPIDFHATREALKDGVVDGQENPLVAIVSMGFHEVQSDLVVSEHAYLGYVFSISEKTFNRLPAEIGLMLVDTARQITPWERAETVKREAAFIEKVKQAGVTVHTLSAEQKERFAEKTRHIVKAFEDVIGADVISSTEAILLKEFGPAHDAEQQIVIGLNADLSLGAKSAGLAIKRGAELAIREINAAGGILDRPVVLLPMDHRISATRSEKNLREMAARKDLVAVLGGLQSAIVEQDIPHLQSLKLPYLVPWAASAGLTDLDTRPNYIFRLSADDALASRFIAENAVKKHTRPAIIVENSNWGRGNLENMQSFLQSKGISPVMTFTYNRGMQDFTSAINDLVKSGADSVILVANYLEGSKLLKQMVLSNELLTVPVFSHWGILGGPFYENNKMVLSKIDVSIFQSLNLLTREDEIATTFLRDYLQQYGKNSIKQIHAPAGVAQAYDLVHLLSKAVQKAGEVDRAKIRLALENLDTHQGLIKQYAPAFSEDNHEALDEGDFIMARYNVHGMLEPVK